MLAEQSLVQDLRNAPLAERVGIQVENLLVQREPFDHWLRGCQPGYAQAGGQDFGEGAEVDHLSRGIQRLERLWAFALEVDLSVGVVLQDGSRVAPREQQQAPPAFWRHDHSRRILEGWLRVDQAGPVTGQDGFQQVNTHTIFVRWHADDPRLQGAESLDGSYISRHFYHDLVSWIEQQATNQADALG